MYKLETLEILSNPHKVGDTISCNGTERNGTNRNETEWFRLLFW